MYKRNSLRFISLPAPAPVPDWSKLCRNDQVEVRTAGRPAMSGTIDMITANRSVFWIIRNDGAGRTMVCFGDDVSVRRIAPAKAAGIRERVTA